ncbi:hypothetical protein AAMO2058_001537200 [Amorphochlora amoebiformis]
MSVPEKILWYSSLDPAISVRLGDREEEDESKAPCIQFQGNIVKSVVKGSQGYQKGIQAGWVLRRINGNRVTFKTTTAEVIARLRKLIKDRRNLYLRFDVLRTDSSDEGRGEREEDREDIYQRLKQTERNIEPPLFHHGGFQDKQGIDDDVDSDLPAIRMGSELVSNKGFGPHSMEWDGPGSKFKPMEPDVIPWDKQKETLWFLRDNRRKKEPRIAPRPLKSKEELEEMDDNKWTDEKPPPKRSKWKKGSTAYRKNHFSR